eukprot:s2887_g9.t1
MRSERLNVLLLHIRKLARTGPTQACVNALSGQELGRPQNTLKKVVMQEAVKKNEKQEKEDEQEEEDEEEEEEEEEDEERPKKRKLKVNPSDALTGISHYAEKPTGEAGSHAQQTLQKE